jgi:thioester reductase-like protein
VERAAGVDCKPLSGQAATTGGQAEHVLLTGATGFLGRHLLRSLLERLGHGGAVACLVRADSAEEADRRLDAILGDIGEGLAPEARARCHAVWGDVTHEGLAFPNGPGRASLEDIDRIVHCAANVKFNLPLDRARRINVDGTRNVLRLAQTLDRSGQLRRVDYIGTAFVAGATDGPVFEDDLVAIPTFHNTYERTKWEAEKLVRVFQRDLPIAIFRPSIVVGDSRTGETANYRVLYWPLKLLARGAVPFVPADPEGIVDVVPVDHVVEAIDALSRDEESLGRCYHIAAGPEHARSLGHLTRMAAEFFGVRAPYLVPPALIAAALKPLLYGALWGKRRKVLETATHYFPYFAYRASFDTSRASSALARWGIETPDVEGYFRTILQYCVDTDWGRRTSAIRKRPATRRQERPAEAPGVSRRNGSSRRWSSFLDLFTRRMDPADLGNRDPKFIEAVAPALDHLRLRYFRSAGEGMEHVPASGPFIAVANHSGGPLLPDVFMMLPWWAMTMGTERPAYAMLHDLLFRIPVVNNFLMKVGGLPDSTRNAERALDAGAGVLTCPGGDLDCFRSFRDRNKIDFFGRTGFIELAFKLGVPILPLVCVGGHEVYWTIFSSRRLARWSGIERLTRVKTVPMIVGAPWGVWFTGFLPYIPLPAKLEYRVGEPIHVEHDPKLAADRDAVQHVYDRVTAVMQAMVDEVASRRRFPVLG